MQNDPLDPGKINLSGPSVEREANRLTQAARSRRRAWVLSLAGFVPFAVLAIVLVFISSDNPIRLLLIDALKTYGAVILSFLGGMRWGLAMKASQAEDSRLIFGFSVIPSLVGWFSLFLPLPYVFAVQALAFAGQGAWDSFAGQRGVFGLWFVRLRTTLTFLVTAALVTAFFATT